MNAVSSDRRRAARGGRRGSDRPGRHPIVLVADSYDDARFPVVRYLDHYGFEVMEAGSAVQAVDILERYHPPVILSGLRGKDASDLYDRLARGTPAARPAVIALLSSIDDPVPVPAIGVLTKPFSLRPMLDALRRALQIVAC